MKHRVAAAAKQEPPKEEETTTVRVDVFKPSGVWVDTLDIAFPRNEAKKVPDNFRDALVKALLAPEHGSCRYAGFTAVCIDHGHTPANPLMVTIPDR